jgi:hypothetical protein
MLAKGYTELTGLFRILQNDVLALFILLVRAWITGYWIDFDLHLFDQVPFGLKREDLKLFGDLGGLAVATALIALVLFVLQGFLRLGSPLVALMDRVFPVTIR